MNNNRYNANTPPEPQKHTAIEQMNQTYTFT
jgi:hypothetical protein